MNKRILFILIALVAVLVFTVPVSAERLDDHTGEYIGDGVQAYSLQGKLLNHWLCTNDWYEGTPSDGWIVCAYPITRERFDGTKDVTDTNRFEYDDRKFDSGVGSFSNSLSSSTWYNKSSLSACNISYHDDKSQSSTYVSINHAIDTSGRTLMCDSNTVLGSYISDSCYYDLDDTDDADYGWSPNKQSLSDDVSNANDGVNTVYYAGMDNHGNYTLEQQDIWYDNTAPTVSLDSVSSDWTSEDQDLEIKFDDEMSGLKNASFTVQKKANGHVTTQDYSASLRPPSGTPQSGDASTEETLTFTEDGVYEITKITATDYAGNSYNGKGGQIKIDKMPPTGDLQGFNLDTSNDTLTTTVSNVSDGEGSGVKSVWCELTDVDDPYNMVDIPLSGSNGTYTLGSTPLLDINGACFRESNQLYATIYGMDKVGNVGQIGGTETLDLLYITASVWPTAEPYQNIAKQGQQLTFTVYTVGDPVNLSFEYPYDIYGVNDSGLYDSTEIQSITEQDVATNIHTYTLSLYVPMTLAPQYKDDQINRLQSPYSITVTATKNWGYTKSVTLNLDVQNNIYYQFRTKFVN